MNYQIPGRFQPEAPDSDNEVLKATLRRLHLALDPHNPAPDIHHARAIVDSLIGLTHAPDIPVYEPAEVYRSGRRHLILQALLRSAGKVCSKRELADLCHVSTNSTRVIKVYVCQIRAALAAHGLGEAIETIWGVGYMIRPSDARKIRDLIRRQNMVAAAASVAAGPAPGNASN